LGKEDSFVLINRMVSCFVAMRSRMKVNLNMLRPGMINWIRC